VYNVLVFLPVPSPGGFNIRNMIITIFLLLLLCALCADLGYKFGQHKERLAHARQLSELARETVKRDITLAKLEKVIEGLKNEAQ
jgi:hypothetical protein